MTKRLVLIAVGSTVLVTGGLFTNASAKTKHISKISNVRVTGSKVYGHTTKYANVKLLSTKNKLLGHSKANKKGNFIIKTQKSLKKVAFKFKASKKGYVSRNQRFLTKNNAKSTNKVTNRIKNNTAINKAKNAVANAQSNVNTIQRNLTKNQESVNKLSAELPDMENHLSVLKSNLAGLNPNSEEYKRAYSEYQYQTEGYNGTMRWLSIYKQRVESYTGDLTRAKQTLSSAKANLATLS